MKARALIASTFAGCLLCQAALAGEAECRNGGDPVLPTVTRADVDALIGWIAMKTDYDLSAVYRDPPEIVFCHVGEIVDYEDDGLLVDDVLNAAYDLSRRRIYLVLPWSPDDPVDRSALLHELVHAVQLDNRDWPCPGAPEWEAYGLQASWLREQGVATGFDWAAIYRLSRCPEPAPE